MSAVHRKLLVGGLYDRMQEAVDELVEEGQVSRDEADQAMAQYQRVDSPTGGSQ